LALLKKDKNDGIMRKIIKKYIIINKIKQLCMFFYSKCEIKTDTTLKMKFPSSPNYYKYIILKDNLLIYLGSLMGNLWGTMGLLWGTMFYGIT